MRRLTLLLCLVASAAAALAQDKPAVAPPHDKPPAVASTPENPFSAFNKQAYGYLKDVLLRSAEKMPEENYNFKPTESVRSFGQVLGHVADSNYMFCSKALGETNPAPKVEQTKTSKADLIASLKAAFAYCDKAYDGMTDSTAEKVKLFGGEQPKPVVLTVNNLHTVEHYGNVITYLRLKNIVPPSSEPKESQPQPKKPEPSPEPKK